MTSIEQGAKKKRWKHGMKNAPIFSFSFRMPGLLVLHHGLKGILLYIFLEKSFKNE